MTTATSTPSTTRQAPTYDQLQSAAVALGRNLQSRAGTGASDVRATPTTAEQEIFAEVSRAVDAWRTSPEGQAALKPETFDADELRRRINGFLKSDAFAPSRDLIMQQKQLSDDKISFPIQAVTLGFAVQVDLIGGLYFSIGYGADIDDIDNTSVIYILGALQEGAIEGADVAVQVGLWKDSTKDLDGYYNGQNVDIEDFGGVAVFSLESDHSVVAYLIDVGVGEDDGIAEDQVLVFTFDIGHSPVAQADADHFLILTQLECEKTSETGHDEVYFTFTPDGGTEYRYPTWKYYSMSEDSSDPEHLWSCGRSVKLNSSVSVVLWDSDDANDDQIGNFTFNVSDFSGPGDSVSKTYDHTEFFNQVKYKMTAKLIY